MNLFFEIFIIKEIKFYPLAISQRRLSILQVVRSTLLTFLFSDHTTKKINIISGEKKSSTKPTNSDRLPKTREVSLY